MRAPHPSSRESEAGHLTKRSVLAARPTLTRCPHDTATASDSIPSPNATSRSDSAVRSMVSPGRRLPSVHVTPVAGDGHASRTNQANRRSTGAGRSTELRRSSQAERPQPVAPVPVQMIRPEDACRSIQLVQLGAPVHQHDPGRQRHRTSPSPLTPLAPWAPFGRVMIADARLESRSGVMVRLPIAGRLVASSLTAIPSSRPSGRSR